MPRCRGCSNRTSLAASVPRGLSSSCPVKNEVPVCARRGRCVFFSVTLGRLSVCCVVHLCTSVDECLPCHTFPVAGGGALTKRGAPSAATGRCQKHSRATHAKRAWSKTMKNTERRTRSVPGATPHQRDSRSWSLTSRRRDGRSEAEAGSTPAGERGHSALNDALPYAEVVWAQRDVRATPSRRTTASNRSNSPMPCRSSFAGRRSPRTPRASA